MRLAGLIVFSVMALSFSGIAAGPKVAVFEASREEVAGRIAAACLDRGWFVAKAESTVVQCNRPDVPEQLVRWGPRGAAWTVAMTFKLVGDQDRTRVQVTERIEFTDQLGNNRVERYRGKIEGESAVDMIAAIGGVFPVR